MRPAFRILFSALALPLAAVPAHARQTVVAMVPSSPPEGERPAPDPDKLQRLIAEADQASIDGRDAEARRLYRTVVDEQRRGNLYAGTALWRLAGLQLFQGKTVDVAITLDETAQEAARFGDPAMELRATFEAAIMWQKVKRNDVARARLERVRCLLQSPAIDAKLKNSVESRIVG